jgi:hypothetical protein
VLGSATLFVCAGAAFGWHQYVQFLAALEELSRSFPLGSEKFALANAVYLLGHKVGVDLEPRLPAIQMLINVCSLMLFVVVMWLGRRRPKSHWTYVALALVITLTPNIVWYHHFVFLLPAVLVVFWESHDDWGRWLAGAYLLVIQLLPWAIPSNYRPAVMTSCSVLLLGFVLRRLIQEPETSLQGETC